MDKWYVVEVLQHKLDPTKPVKTNVIVSNDLCPIVKLRPFEHSSLKLWWSEESGDLEYTFRIPNINTKKGLWRNMYPQNGKFSHYFGSSIYRGESGIIASVYIASLNISAIIIANILYSES